MSLAFQIRPIRADDNAAMAAIIRSVMPEFGAGGAGFAINDPEVDWLSRAYAQPCSAYFVVERDGVVLGGGGVAPLEGGDGTICELRKMYFLPAARGLGAGAAMMRACLAAARGFGFAQCYIETLDGMDAAMRLYEKTGFVRLDAPLGATGHGGCDRWYLLQL
ncbi:GNAT family N-acetyltransferase [Pseudoxanthomonas sp.]|uniref:GNAT family N-acetyltransferase n=1 Tax=Pseudoxanthomonas sp. TaxID=1871049 RepID=UPI00262EC29D|nr:GNAT family N-acetyltransferase [Pseudoxanthomonas sp.]WDS36663.1 MAG: GNAT family N-acetyltransferase [Pseudoxanthomonas sp.]